MPNKLVIRKWIKRAIWIWLAVASIFFFRECRHYDPLGGGWTGLVGDARRLKPIRSLGSPEKIEQWAYSRKNFWEVEGACHVLGYIAAYSLLPRSGRAYWAYVRIVEKLAEGWIEELTPTYSACYKGNGVYEYVTWEEKYDGNMAAFWEESLQGLVRMNGLIEVSDWIWRPRYREGEKRVEDALYKFRVKNWPRRKVGVGSCESYLPKTPPSESKLPRRSEGSGVGPR